MKSIAFLGTGSSVGKSLISAGICRLFSNMNYKTVPFKAQNMSNNSGVTYEGFEMGRAQIIQAISARCLPSAHMNPVLIKPVSNMGSQVIVQGKVFKNTNAYSYFSNTDDLFSKACESFDKLSLENDACVIEGAGSCCELNLKNRDFVNFKMAKYANAKVVIVGDIDKGGIFAQLIGTWNLLSNEEKDLVIGFVINKFRGDIRLFEDGIKIIEEKTGKKVIGVIPYFYDINIEEEDGISSKSKVDLKDFYMDDKINVGIIKLPRISNFTDFNPLEMDDRFNVVYFYKNLNELSKCDVLILPGTKFTIGDILWLKNNNFNRIIKSFKNKMIVGICGGFQMMGNIIEDKYNLESDLSCINGFGLINSYTYMLPDKILTRIDIKNNIFGNINGYEIHLGKTVINESFKYKIDFQGRTILVFDPEKKILGTYIHGIFDSLDFRNFFIKNCGFKNRVSGIECKYSMDAELDKLASYIKKYLDMDFVLKEMNL